MIARSSHGARRVRVILHWLTLFSLALLPLLPPSTAGPVAAAASPGAAVEAQGAASGAPTGPAGETAALVAPPAPAPAPAIQGPPGSTPDFGVSARWEWIYGNRAVWRVDLHNYSQSDATGVVLTETIPPGFALDGWAVRPRWNWDSDCQCERVVGGDIPFVAESISGTQQVVFRPITGTLPTGYQTSLIVTTTAPFGASGTFVYAAVATSDPPDNSPWNSQASSAVSFTPDVGVSVNRGPQDGRTVAWNINFNNGDSVAGAAGIVATDTLPAGFTFAGWYKPPRTRFDRGCNCNVPIGDDIVSYAVEPVSGTQQVLIRPTDGEIPPQYSDTVVLTTTAPFGAIGTYTNTAVISAVSDRNLSNNQSWPSTVTFTPNPSASVKTGVQSGRTIGWNVNLNNYDQVADAAGVVATVTLPTGFVLTDWLDGPRSRWDSGCNCYLPTGDDVVSLIVEPVSGTQQVLIHSFGGVLPANYADTVTLTTTAPPGGAGTFTTTVTIGSATPDNNPGDNTGWTTWTLTPDPSVSTSRGPTSGRTVVWNVYVNNGSSVAGAQGVVVTDTVPPGFTLNAWSYQPRTWWSNACRCSVPSGDDIPLEIGPTADQSALVIRPLSGTLPASYAGTVVLTATAPLGAAGTFTNTVTVASTSADSNLGNNQGSSSVTLGADLTASTGWRSASGSTVVWGARISNVGAVDAADVVVTETLPTGFSLVDGLVQRLVWDAGCQCDLPVGGDLLPAIISPVVGTPNVYVILPDNLVPAGYWTRVILTTTAPLGASGTYTNSVAVAGTTAETSLGNNQASATVLLPVTGQPGGTTGAPDLGVVSPPGPGPQPRPVMTRTVGLKNNTLDGDAPGAALTVTLPTGLTPLGWRALPRTRWDAGCSCLLTLGDDLGWTAESAAGLMVFRPAGGTLPGGYWQSFVLTASATLGGVFAVGAAVGGALPDPYLDNNQVTSTLTLSPDLRASTSTGPRLNRTIAWNISFGNSSGSFDAPGAVLTDTLPPGFTLIGWFDRPRTRWDLGCACYVPLGDDVPFAVQTVTDTQEVVIRPVSGALPAGYFDNIYLTTTVPAGPIVSATNTVAIASGAVESNLKDNQGSTTATFNPDPAVSAKITNWSGNLLAWRISVNNYSSVSDAGGVVVTDTLPPGFVLNGWYDQPRTYWDANCRCNLLLSGDIPFTVQPISGTQDVVILPLNGVLPANYADTIVLTATALGGQSGPFTNTVVITSTTPDSNTGNNRSATSGSWTPDPNVGTWPGSISGRTYTWNINLGNGWMAEAAGVVVTDTLPAGSTLTGWYKPPRTYWDLNCRCTVPYGDDISYTVEPVSGTQQVVIRPADGVLPVSYWDNLVLTTTMPIGPGGRFTNSVTLSSTTPDSYIGNNQSTAWTSVDADPSVSTWSMGQWGPTVAWAVSFNNWSTVATAAGVLITDTLPDGFTLTGWFDRPRRDAAGNPLGDDLAIAVQPVSGTQQVQILLPDGVLPGGYWDTVVLTTTAPAGAGGSFTNTVAVASATTDRYFGNNSNWNTVSLQPQFADVAVNAHMHNGGPPRRDPVLNVHFDNFGDLPAADAIISVSLPPGVRLAGYVDEPRRDWDPVNNRPGEPLGDDVAFVVEPVPGPVFLDDPQLVLIRPLSGTLPPHYWDTVVLTLTVDGGIAGPITPTVSIETSSDENGRTGNNGATVSYFVSRDVRVFTALHGPWNLVPGQQTVFNVDFGNNGSAPAPGATILDTIPPSTTIQSWAVEQHTEWVSPTLQVPWPGIPYTVTTVPGGLQIVPATPDQVLPAFWADRIWITLTLASDASAGQYTNTATVATTGVEVANPYDPNTSGLQPNVSTATFHIEPLHIWPYPASNITDVAFTVLWQTNASVGGFVRYRELTATTLLLVAPDVRGAGTVDMMHFVPVEGLLPSREYYYEIVSGDAVLTGTVRTGPTLGSIPPVDQVHGYVYQAPDGTIEFKGGPTDGLRPLGGAVVTVRVRDGDGQGSGGEASWLGGLSNPDGSYLVNVVPRQWDGNYFEYSPAGEDRFVVDAIRWGIGSGHRVIRTSESRRVDVVLGYGNRQERWLDGGWNLISLPVSPTAPLHASDVLRQLDGEGEGPTALVRWRSGRWDSYLAGFPANDFELRLGEAYFVQIRRPGAWVIFGEWFQSAPPLTIAAGWTAIGLPYDDWNYSAEDLLRELSAHGVQATHLLRWQQGMWESHVRGMGGPGFQLGQDSWGHRQPANGYFVRSDGYTTWTPSR